MIKKAKEILASLDAELVSRGKIPQITYIFRAKNFFGMKDVQDYILTPNNPSAPTLTQRLWRKKYQSALPGATIEVKDGRIMYIPELWVVLRWACWRPSFSCC